MSQRKKSDEVREYNTARVRSIYTKNVQRNSMAGCSQREATFEEEGGGEATLAAYSAK